MNLIENEKAAPTCDQGGQEDSELSEVMRKSAICNEKVAGLCFTFAYRTFKEPEWFYERLGEQAVLLPIPKGLKGPINLGWSDTTYEQTESGSFYGPGSCSEWPYNERNQYSVWVNPAPNKRQESSGSFFYWDNIGFALSTDGNLGVLLGSASGHLCTIDCDTDELAQWMLEHNPDLQKTFRTRGSRGCQFWVRILGWYPEKVYKLKSIDGTVLKLEWRGGNGCQSVVYGEHPDGHDYQILNDAPAIEIEFKKIKWPENAVQPWLKSEGNNSGGPEKSAPNPNIEAGNLEKRIRAYIDAIPGAISGQNGHNQTFDVARQLRNGFGLDSEEVEKWLAYYNQKCEPQWSESELKHKANDAVKWPHYDKPHGHLLDDGKPANLIRHVADKPNDERQLKRECSNLLHCPDLKWEPLSRYPESQVGLVKYDSIYESDNKQLWIVDRDEKWISVTEAALKRKLNQQFFLSKKADEGESSEIDVELRNITEGRNVAFACSLAGYRRGVYRIPSGERILVTDDPKPVMPVPGDWDLLGKFIEELLGPEQTTYFIAWISVAVRSLYERTFRPGQALILAGPKDCGKTFLQTEIITPILGGRTAKPYQFMTGGTPFNADLFLAEHQMISDENPRADLAARREFATAIKNICSNPDQRLHAKCKNARVLRPFWRLTISLNDEPENLVMLPIIEESIVDKILLFKVTRPTCLPRDESDREPFLQQIRSELPAFVDYLMNYKIPADLRSGRFGVRYYINPEINAELNSLSPEAQLLDLVDCVLFGLDDEIGPFTSTQIYTRLICSGYGDAARKLLSGGSKTAGNYLRRLAKAKNPRVFTFMSNGSSRYRIFKADSFSGNE